MAFQTYRSWARTLSISALLGEWGGKISQTFALMFDAEASTTVEAGACNQLNAPTFPIDALPLKGSDRNIERYPGESDASYMARVAGAWVAWPQAGTHNGLLGQLTAAGFTATIKEMRDWNWDGNTANWSRFWVVITGTGWARTHWGDGRKWGEGVWGCNAPLDQVHVLRRIVRKWKPGHMVAIIVVVLDDVAWAAGQPDGTWGNPANRNHAALYHYER